MHKYTTERASYYLKLTAICFLIFILVFYQQSLQTSVLFLQMLHGDPDGHLDGNLRTNLMEFLGPSSSKELEWISDCIGQGIQHYMEVENGLKVLRLPLILAEQNYIETLRQGAALRSLRRVYVACQVERLIRDCVDGIIAGTYSTFILMIFCL